MTGFDVQKDFEDRASAVAEAFELALEFYQKGYTLIPANIALINVGKQAGRYVYTLENKEVVTGFLCVDPARFEVNWATYGPDFLSQRNHLLEEGWEVVAADEVMEHGCVYFIRPK